MLILTALFLAQARHRPETRKDDLSMAQARHRPDTRKDDLSMAKARHRPNTRKDDLSLAQTRHRPDTRKDNQMQNIPWSWDPFYVPKNLLCGTPCDKPKKIKDISEILSEEILRYSKEILRKDMEDDKTRARAVVVQTRNGRNKWNRIQKRGDIEGSKDRRIRLLKIY